MKSYSAVVEVWRQCSPDNAVQKTEVIAIDHDTTVAELMEYVAKWNVCGIGDVRIVESTELP